LSLRHVCLIAAVAAAAVGCGNGHKTASTSSPSATAATSTTPPATGGTSTAASPSSIATSTPSTRPSASPAATTTCQPGQLSLTVASTGAAAGSSRVTYVFRNISAGACSLYGYPGMQMLDAAGHPLPTTVIRGSSVTVPALPKRLVVLQPKGAASFYAGYSNVPTGSEQCPSSARVEVTPPNDYSHLTISEKIAPCGGRITVSPVFPS
jgi:hypothetical protein